MQNTNRHEFTRIVTNEFKRICPEFVCIRADSCRFVFLHLMCALLVLVTANLFAAGPTAVPDSPADLPKGPPPPPVPLLRADQAIATMQLAEGFRIETVAEEPLVEHPVAMAFDADGRIWVVEMRSYMPDVEGNGEDAPSGRVKFLEDLDGDGRMDKSTVFLDKLVLPRAVGIVRDGVLIAAPPRLLFCRDTNGDGQSDEQTVVATDYGVPGNPEHMPNGLMPGVDNWLYSANYDKRIRYDGHAWHSEIVPELGQWGISQDDFGRLFHNTNTDQLRGSLIAPHYADRNPHYRTAVSVNEQIAKDQTVWPAHATAVDRGYLAHLMRRDGTLRNFTAACAPLVYRGGLFPRDLHHNAFVCEPAANLIKRNVIVEGDDGTLLAKNAYEKTEFLRSTYERFRPVNLNVGPDGALYVVDMHHGLIQHKTYLTTYCKEQYEAKQLNRHMMTGRLYRIVPANAPRPLPTVKLSKATTPQLIEHLAHTNGQVRDTAQRLLVERGDVRALSPLRKMATKHANPLARLHALWTLDGMRVRDPNVILAALNDREPKIRAAAIRLAEPLLASPIKDKATAAVLQLVEDSSADVRLQFALTVSALGTPEGDAAVIELLSKVAPAAPTREARGIDGDERADAGGRDAVTEPQHSSSGDTAGGRYIKRAEPTISAPARARR
jgi:glucose/arabinose dehydrogenase